MITYEYINLQRTKGFYDLKFNKTGKIMYSPAYR